MAELSQAANKSSMGDFATSGQTEQINSLSAAIDRLSEKLGEELPENSRKGTEQFHRDSAQFESDQRKVGGGFNFIRDAIEKLNTIARQNRLQTFIQALSLSRLNEIADGLGEITSQGRNLTTGLEAEMLAMSKSARAAGANFGYTGQQLGKFANQAAGMAKDLNIDANTAAMALRGWHEAGSELAAMGFRSAKEVAKFADAFGVSADVLRNSGLRMRKEFLLTDDQINQVAGSFVRMGQLTGDVTSAMNDMPAMMDLLRRRAASMGQELDSQELADYAASTAALAAGFMQMGHSSDQARQNAMGMAEQMMAARESFRNMFGGTQDDISEFHKAFGIATGDIQTAFKSMTQGPDEFVAGIAGMVQQAKATGRQVDFRVLQAQLESVFGKDQAAQLVNFFQRADKATLDLMKSVKQTPGELGKLAKQAHRTGRTLAESFELAKDRFIKNFRGISRKEARTFVKDTNKQFGKFGKKLQELAAKKGPLGAFIRKVSEAHQVGGMMFVPETLRPMVALMGEATKEAAPMITALGAIGLRLKMIINPFTLILGSLAALAVWFKKSGMSAEEFGTMLSEKIGKGVAMAAKLLKSFVRKLPEILETLVTVLKQVAPPLLKAAKEIFAQLWEVAKQIPWRDIGFGILNGLKKAVNVAFKLLAQIDWGHVFSVVFTAMQNFIAGLFGSPVQGSLASELGAFVGDTIVKAFWLAVDAIKQIAGVWADAVFGIWADETKTIGEKVKGTATGLAATLAGVFMIKGTALGKGLMLLGGAAKSVAASLMTSIGGKAGLLSGLKKMGSLIMSPAGGVVAGLTALAVGAHFLAKKVLEGQEKKIVRENEQAPQLLMERLFGVAAGEFNKQTQRRINKMAHQMGVSVPKTFEEQMRVLMPGMMHRVTELGITKGQKIDRAKLAESLGMTKKQAQLFAKTQGSAEQIRMQMMMVADADMVDKVLKFEQGLKKVLVEQKKINAEEQARARLASVAVEVAEKGKGTVEATVGAARRMFSVFASGTVTQTTASIEAMEQVKQGAAAKAEEITSTVRNKTMSLFRFLNLDISTGISRAKEFIAKGMETLRQHAEESAPAKSIIVTAKDLKEVGPQAKHAFGVAGRAMDRFGGVFSQKFKGAESIDAIANRAFNNIEKAAKKLKTSLTLTIRDMWADILAMTAAAIKAIQQDSVAVSRQLKAVTTASSIVAEAKQEASPSAPPQKTFKAGQSKDEQMLQATHWPDWYTQSFVHIAKQIRDATVTQAAVGTGEAGASERVAKGLRGPVRRAVRFATRELSTGGTNIGGQPDGGR